MTVSATTSALARTCGAAAVVGWEAPGAAPPSVQLAALSAIAARIGHACAAIAVPIDPELSGMIDGFVEIARRHHIALLPIVHVDGRDVSGQWRRSTMPVSIARLAGARVLYEFAGVRYAIVSIPTGEGDPQAVQALAAALAAPDRKAHIGWRRAGSRHVELPQGFDFAVEWPPYGGGVPSSSAQGGTKFPHALLVGDLTKRSPGDGIVVPSVLWSATRSANVLEGRLTLADFLPSRFAHMVDGAARYVSNRERECAPFWLVRAAFSPADPAHLGALALLRDELLVPYRASVALGKVCGPIIVPARRARIAAVVHLYYPELWSELADALDNIPEAFDLYLSCPFRLHPAVQQQVTARFPSASVFGVQNLGRDVLPFLLWLRTVGPDAYDYVLKLHGKRSAHMIDTDYTVFGGGDDWRRNAFGELVGNREHARRMLFALDETSDIGLVAPAGFLYDQVKWRCATGDLVLTLLDRLGVEREVRGSFPAGTMFWARMAALRRLAELPDMLLDFEREAGQTDGTLHHAWERVLALVAEDAGYRVIESAALMAAVAR